MYNHEIMKKALGKKKEAGLDLTIIMGGGGNAEEKKDFAAGGKEEAKEMAAGQMGEEDKAHEAKESPAFELGEEDARKKAEKDGELAPTVMDDDQHKLMADGGLHGSPHRMTALKHAAMNFHKSKK